MQNPDPKRFKLKKLRGKGYILIPLSLLKWRKKRKEELKSKISKKQVEALFTAPQETHKKAPSGAIEVVDTTLPADTPQIPLFDFFGASQT